MRYSAPHLFPNILIRANKEGLERRSTIDMILSDRAPPIKDDIIIALLNINMIIIARSFCSSIKVEILKKALNKVIMIVKVYFRKMDKEKC